MHIATRIRNLMRAKRLNALGVPPPSARVWGHTAIASILRRRTYIGEIRWGEVTKSEALPAIVDAELFERTQRRLGTREGGKPSDYFLTGVAKCAHCGGAMNGKTTQSRGKWYRSYVCATHRRSGTCRFNWHNAERLEDLPLAENRCEVCGMLIDPNRRRCRYCQDKP